jgi:pimeloyl-ACP methyl ester carboxylesterase
VVTDPTLLTAPAFVADLDRLRESLGIARVTLLGHSWGAGLAARYGSASHSLLTIDQRSPAFNRWKWSITTP